MLHALALIKIENRRAKHFFKPFFQVAFIHRHLTAQFLNCDGLADMLNQNFSRPAYFFPVSFIGEEFTVDYIDFLIPDHAIHAVQQQHLHLRIDKDIFQAIGIVMIE